ncbi:MAG TPA: DinB family protein [Fimbriimonas sp.]|nr:DinB family protein [Fimbriimonas sp.]
MSNAITLAKLTAEQGMDMFLRNFSHVPDDKLHWKVTPTAKSALHIAAHTALYNHKFAKMIREKKVPVVGNLDEWLAQQSADEEAITSRAEMERVFRAGLAEVLEALDTLTEEDVSLEIDSGQGWSMSMGFLMRLPGWHATLHLGQIDFLQTCWGDQEIYVG